jgi:hypothetical protein
MGRTLKTTLFGRKRFYVNNMCRKGFQESGDASDDAVKRWERRTHTTRAESAAPFDLTPEIPMFTTIVLLFMAVLLVLAAAATRGLLRINEILEVIEPGEPDPALSRSLDHS